MKYLTSEYWEKINIDYTQEKGIRFEELVLDLLIAEYGKTTFKKTRHSWDGSKDFFYYSEHRNFWAECKNYSSNIGLKVLASTLIMAQISEIDTVLFYSYSPININTKAKLLINAQKKNSTVYFYDDVVLEQKIFQYWNFIGDKYFPKFQYKDCYSEHPCISYELKCLLFGNPLDLECSIEEYEVAHLALFKMFEMNICIINRENRCNIITLEFKEKLEEVKARFEIYPEHIIQSKMKVSLIPYEGKIIRIWLIPIKENCIIPHPYINGKQLSLPKNVEFKNLKLENKNIQRLIGRSYEQCVEDFRKEVLYVTNKVKLGIFYGTSGTGKTKLYNECLKISKINGYEIIDFCNIRNIKENFGVAEFIQKLLVSIYDISLETLKQIFDEIALNDSSHSSFSRNVEYCMLSDIFRINTETEMQQWIKRYLNTIVLKLTNSKFVIAIDNVQFFDDDIVNLLHNICNRLIQCPFSSTKFLLIFNTDYIKRNSVVDLFMSSYTANKIVTFSEYITGFKDSGECYEFLQETFSIGDIFEKAEIVSIAQNMNSNPFYLEQMIYWLRDKHAIEQKDEHYIIKDEILLRSLISSIPNSVYDILNMRWEFYKENNQEDSDRVLVLFSALHLYKELDKEDIDALGVTWSLIKELERMGFVAIEDNFNTIIIKFRHDLIDKYFSKMYHSFAKQIIEYENQIKICLRNNEIRYYFEILYNMSISLTDEQIPEMLDLHIDGRIAYEFYLLVFNRYLNFFVGNNVNDYRIWITNMYRIIIYIHDILGNKVMFKCIDALLLKLRDKEKIEQYIEYGNLILYISEAYDSMGNYQEAVRVVQNYKNNVFSNQDLNKYTIEQKKLLSAIYNRLHVYRRHQISCPLDNKEIMEYLNISSKIADNIQNKVMQYVNYSDRGYLYYDLPKSREEHINTMLYWKEACKIYEQGGAEQKEINYLRKRVQLALLEGKSRKAIRKAEIGLEQIDTSPNAYQQTFFKWWFYHALAESYLMDYKHENSNAIEKALEHAHFYSELLNSNKKFYYLQLKAIYLFYQGKRETAFTLNQEAINLVENSNYKMKRNSLKYQLLENQRILCSDKPEPQNNLYSQIHTSDNFFNLPCM